MRPYITLRWKAEVGLPYSRDIGPHLVPSRRDRDTGTRLHGDTDRHAEPGTVVALFLRGQSGKNALCNFRGTPNHNGRQSGKASAGRAHSSPSRIYLANGFGCAGNYRIAGEVALTVVDHFQIINIEEKRRITRGVARQITYQQRP